MTGGIFEEEALVQKSHQIPAIRLEPTSLTAEDEMRSMRIRTKMRERLEAMAWFEAGTKMCWQMRSVNSGVMVIRFHRDS